jgi:hypothetical protein
VNGKQAALIQYRRAQREHRLQALEHHAHHRTVNAGKHNAAANWISRAVEAELLDPQPAPHA